MMARRGTLRPARAGRAGLEPVGGRAASEIPGTAAVLRRRACGGRRGTAGGGGGGGREPAGGGERRRRKRGSWPALEPDAALVPRRADVTGPVRVLAGLRPMRM